MRSSPTHSRVTSYVVDIRAFRSDYTSLTGNAPLRWQERLFRSIAKGDMPSAIDLPTGLGKTAIMALWLIACARGAPVPRRLVYVVDRRAVVDQATTFATTLRENLGEKAPHLRRGLGLKERSDLTISTLRGQHVDNREWLDDPASAAIIVGTIDMIGSRLLFEGYGVSRKMRPYHAALVGADALIVLDEAHLAPSFEGLIQALTGLAQSGGCALDNRLPIPALKLVSLSATGRSTSGEVFGLAGSLRSPRGRRQDFDDEFVVRRLRAEKRIKFVPVKQDELVEKLTYHAWHMSRCGKLPIRCLVFTHSREMAEAVRTRVQELAACEGKHIETELLVGARRVREREQVAHWLEATGFIQRQPVERRVPVFLFATSAGEVGIDLDADYLVCDLVPWERMVQRLGRVNRRGEVSARIVVLVAPSQAKALREPFRFLKRRPDGSYDGSPEALLALKHRGASDSRVAAAIKAATTPPPQRPELTRPLVEAWSMTSLREHTGRPEVSPWLRGWIEQKPQTTVIWRRFLPVRPGEKATLDEIEDFFEAAPLHLSEQLESDTFHVNTWLRERCANLLNERGSPDVIGFVLSPSGDLVETLELKDFAVRDDKSKTRRLEDKLQRMGNAQLVVDARVRGLKDGLLNSDSSDDPDTADSCADWFPHPETPRNSGRRIANVGFRVRPMPQRDDSDPQWQERYRFAVERDDDGIEVRWLVVEKLRGNSATEVDRSVSGNYQLLVDHQRLTETRMRNLARGLALPRALTEALALAARLHDEGKRAARWQRAFKAPSGRGPYAKTRGPIDFAVLGSYRHEFGSLRYVEKDPAFRRLPEDLQDLVLHLVASHHGQARPLIVTAGCDDAPPSVLEERARQVALRFARLQERWGPWGLAWLETLLRAADQQASKENDERLMRPV